MPSTMIHLMLAEKLSSNAPTEFYIGNVAPDAIYVRENYSFEDKDRLHFRTSENPLKDLENLAKEIDITIPYCEGYICHLFLDTHWDNDCMKPFRRNHGADNWFHDYRKEISKASAWLYHNDHTLKKIWTDMMNYSMPINKNIQGITNDEIQQYFNVIYTWYEKYKLGESTVYPNDFVEKYTDEIAQKYIKWREKL